MKSYTVQVSPKTHLTFTERGGSLAKYITIILPLPQKAVTEGEEKKDFRSNDGKIHPPWVREIFSLRMGVSRITVFNSPKKPDRLKLKKNIKEGYSWKEILQQVIWILRMHFHPEEGYTVEELLHGMSMKRKRRDREYIEVD